ncbi:hypothetical protein [Ulvibacterium sp.]|uniref:hypothetical protein n=1 Tax=Ulvibacterium sp. TaxID=2665914 RepID=UPI002619FA69|nr:hypothetical protein [Ulvibacterium sp.]
MENMTFVSFQLVALLSLKTYGLAQSPGNATSIHMGQSLSSFQSLKHRFSSVWKFFAYMEKHLGIVFHFTVPIHSMATIESIFLG